jgi:hypothetical protein
LVTSLTFIAIQLTTPNFKPEFIYFQF